MTPEELEAWLGREPFIPLRLHLDGGEVVEVTNPKWVLICGGALQVVTMKPGRAPMVETNRYIPLRKVVRVEQTAAA